MEYTYPDLHDCSISIIGLGYVGLPLAAQFASIKESLINGKSLKRKVIGFDINKKRINELKRNFDRTFEVSEETLSELTGINFVSDEDYLIESDFFIITVPTPIDKNKKPDFSYLLSASKIFARAIKKRKKNSLPFVIFESTVYPGATREICIPQIEDESGKELNKDFICGYSPERINPGDNSKTISKIKKVTSASNEEGSNLVDKLYASIISAGTHMAPSIEVAEAAKVIENIQRDLNIGLVNELSLLFSKLNISSKDVFDAACTKWNFHDFRPGLVGGHCIGVDPYYLTYKAEKHNFHPQLILSARRINDNMSYWVVNKLIKIMCKSNILIGKSKILIMGVSFKEDCNDIRNSKVFDIINQLQEYNLDLSIYDPIVDLSEVYKTHKLTLIDKLDLKIKYDAILIAVGHKFFKEIDKQEWLEVRKRGTIIYDLKGILSREIDCLSL